MKLKLILHGQSGNWERFKLRKGSEKFKQIRAKIITRDRRTCQYCGYSGPDLEVVNRDFNYANNKASNMVTACTLCAKVHFLDSYEMNYQGADKMIYLPELTQVQLNQLVRMVFVKAKSSGEASYNAKMILAQLQDRATWLDERLGTQMSHPAVFTTYMGLTNANKKLIAKIRWLPALESYEDLVESWADALDF